MDHISLLTFVNLFAKLKFMETELWSYFTKHLSHDIQYNIKKYLLKELIVLLWGLNTAKQLSNEMFNILFKEIASRKRALTLKDMAILSQVLVNRHDLHNIKYLESLYINFDK